MLKPYEFLEFGMLGIHPKEPGVLTGKGVRYYADGNQGEFIGSMGLKYPALITELTAVP